MSNQLGFSLPIPTKQQFAATFRTVSQFSFWIQLVLGAISVIALLLAIFSRNLSVKTDNASTGFAIFLAIVGIVLLCFRVYWAFRYRRLAKRLQSPNRELHPSKKDIIKVLQIGLIVSLGGMLLAFLASEVSVVVLLAKALAEPQGVAVYNRENVIRSLDIFIVLANINMIGAHFVGSVTSLGLLEWVEP
ncbi:MAG TPA: hypothetical protein DDZ80_15045 [Cyanobacteria bacterium UBA8803]|nr:hypothetical protein [Cyanobacteria bacterium UBA9273]HBL59744.1 hypothetical protein [Cyanobacteria bacterium UBA8803]